MPFSVSFEALLGNHRRSKLRSGMFFLGPGLACLEPFGREIAEQHHDVENHQADDDGIGEDCHGWFVALY